MSWTAPVLAAPPSDGNTHHADHADSAPQNSSVTGTQTASQDNQDTKEKSSGGADNQKGDKGKGGHHSSGDSGGKSGDKGKGGHHSKGDSGGQSSGGDGHSGKGKDKGDGGKSDKSGSGHSGSSKSGSSSGGDKSSGDGGDSSGGKKDGGDKSSGDAGDSSDGGKHGGKKHDSTDSGKDKDKDSGGGAPGGSPGGTQGPLILVSPTGGSTGGSPGGTQAPPILPPPTGGSAGGPSAPSTSSTHSLPPHTIPQAVGTPIDDDASADAADSGKSPKGPVAASPGSSVTAAGTSGGKTATNPGWTTTLAQAGARFAPAGETTANEPSEAEGGSVAAQPAGTTPVNGALAAGTAAPNRVTLAQAPATAVLPETADFPAAPDGAAAELLEPGAGVEGPSGVARDEDEQTEAGNGTEALRPESSGLLAAPPPADTRILDRALQQLLEQLDHPGIQVKDPAQWGGMIAWVVAGVALTAGAKVRRRRRAAGVAFTEGAGLGWETPEAGEEPDA
jgi:hypothetical protein